MELCHCSPEQRVPFIDGDGDYVCARCQGFLDGGGAKARIAIAAERDAEAAAGG